MAAPKGLKGTSSTVAIGFGINEAAPNTFVELEVDLNLDPLNREVFVVQAVDLTLGAPDALAATNTLTHCSVTTTRQTTVQTLQNSNCMAIGVNQIRAAGFVDGGVLLSQSSAESPPTLLDYVAIIATNDFFVQVEGAGNIAPKGVTGKMYGYRAQASADIYAALVQSEVLSA
jgi:hypothetical protein